MTEKPRIVLKQPERTVSRRSDVAVASSDEEISPVLQNEWVLGRGLRITRQRRITHRFFHGNQTGRCSDFVFHTQQRLRGRTGAPRCCMSLDG